MSVLYGGMVKLHLYDEVLCYAMWFRVLCGLRIIRIDPFYFYVGCRTRQLKLVLVYNVYSVLQYPEVFWCMSGFIALCVSFFSTSLNDWLGRTSCK